jgi:hypothetical protein
VPLFLDHVKVGFKREEDVGPDVAAIVAAGVPGRHRPTRGGIRIALLGMRTNPIASNGYDVRIENAPIMAINSYFDVSGGHDAMARQYFTPKLQFFGSLRPAKERDLVPDLVGAIAVATDREVPRSS